MVCIAIVFRSQSRTDSGKSHCAMFQSARDRSETGIGPTVEQAAFLFVFFVHLLNNFVYIGWRQTTWDRRSPIYKRDLRP
jgi:hypothetical protein